MIGDMTFVDSKFKTSFHYVCKKKRRNLSELYLVMVSNRKRKPTNVGRFVGRREWFLVKGNKPLSVHIII